MSHILRTTLLTSMVTACAVFGFQGRAQAATSCTSFNSVTNTATNAEVVQSYNPFASGSYTYSFQFNSTCLGNGNDTLTIFFLGTSSSTLSYGAPYLTGPNGFQLNFSLCVPGTSCSGGANTWTNATSYAASCNSGSACSSITLTGTTYAATNQNAYVGTFSQYTSPTLYFSATWAH